MLISSIQPVATVTSSHYCTNVLASGRLMFTSCLSVQITLDDDVTTSLLTHLLQQETCKKYPLICSQSEKCALIRFSVLDLKRNLRLKIFVEVVTNEFYFSFIRNNTNNLTIFLHWSTFSNNFYVKKTESSPFFR